MTSKRQVILLVCILVLFVTVVFYRIIGREHHRDPLRISELSRRRFQAAEDCNEYENMSLPRDVIVRSVYFDGRQRDGHNNASVFLVEIRVTILKENGIIGCEVGGQFGTEFEVRPLKLNLNFVHDHHPKLTHDTVLVDCFDLPVQNGSTAHILYKKQNESAVVTCVRSERPLMVPAPPQPANPPWDFTVAVCTAMTYGSPPLLTEWLHYQRALSVDHIHIIAEDSFVTSGGIDNEALRQGIEEGFVSVDVWKPWLKRNQLYYHSQVLAHEACLYRLLGTYSYIMLVDLDEFFIPRVPGEAELHYYAQRCCSYNTSCGSCHFREFMYFPDCGLRGDVDRDGNITARLVSYVSVEQPSVGKSIHIPSAVLDMGCQRAEVFLKGYGRAYCPMEEAYVAHIRTGRKPPDEKC